MSEKYRVRWHKFGDSRVSGQNEPVEKKEALEKVELFTKQFPEFCFYIEPVNDTTTE